MSGPFAFDVAGTYLSIDRFDDGGDDHSYVEVDLTSRDVSAFCSDPDAGVDMNGLIDLVVDVEALPGQTIAPGTYEIRTNGDRDGGMAEILLQTGLPDGGASSPGIVRTGQVTFDTLSGSQASGSFDAHVDFNDGGSAPLSGTFETSQRCQ